MAAQIHQQEYKRQAKQTTKTCLSLKYEDVAPNIYRCHKGVVRSTSVTPCYNIRGTEGSIKAENCGSYLMLVIVERVEASCNNMLERSSDIRCTIGSNTKDGTGAGVYNIWGCKSINLGPGQF